MQSKFEFIKQYLQEMDIAIIDEDAAEELVVVEDEACGFRRIQRTCISGFCR
ncbi:MAG: hypothetical protein JRI61_05530 [Deltaproteobacteria bacterium]|nr:hypothetical protein [Deltaproteobacteria bacterium]